MPSLIYSRYRDFCRAVLQICATPHSADLWVLRKLWKKRRRSLQWRILISGLASCTLLGEVRTRLHCTPAVSRAECPADWFSYTNPPFWEVFLLLPHCLPQATFVSLQHTEVGPAQISFQSWWQNTRSSVFTHLFTAKNRAQESWLMIKDLISPTCLLSTADSTWSDPELKTDLHLNMFAYHNKVGFSSLAQV